MPEQEIKSAHFRQTITGVLTTMSQFSGKVNLNLRMMDGTSLKKFEASTVLAVAAHDIWYPTK